MPIYVITSSSVMQQTALQFKRAGKRIGLVPTMGYLHEGHTSLIRAARANADIVITSIFVNPLQFAAHEDLSRYPRDFDRDLRLAEEAGTDIIFAPSPEEMYPKGFDSAISIGTVSRAFEGAMRPTHFNGVATVVAKLFHLTQPDRAFFGQKDYQQCMVVQKMVHDLALPLEIMICPTVREADGLAMSSRNVYLSPDERQQAGILYQALQYAHRLLQEGVRSRVEIERGMKSVLERIPNLIIDYAAAADAASLQQPEIFSPQQAVVLMTAVRFGLTRLIDNCVFIPEQRHQ